MFVRSLFVKKTLLRGAVVFTRAMFAATENAGDSREASKEMQSKEQQQENTWVPDYVLSLIFDAQVLVQGSRMVFRALALAAASGQAGGWSINPELAEQCPTCVFDAWSCYQPMCHPTLVGALSFQFVYTFEYWHDNQCIEEIPQDDRTMHLDRALRCVAHEELVNEITCENMEEYELAAELFGSCQSPTAGSLMQETCGWYCKNGLPTVRCTYEFDPEGTHGYVEGESHLDYCYVEGVCVNPGEEARIIVCDGTALSHNYAAALEELEAYAAAPGERDLVKELREVQEDHSATKLSLNMATLEKERLGKDLVKARGAHEDAEEENQVLTIALAATACVLAGVLVAAIVVWKRRKPLEIVISSHGDANAANPTVVMGRNVSTPAAAESPQQKAPVATGMAYAPGSRGGSPELLFA